MTQTPNHIFHIDPVTTSMFPPLTEEQRTAARNAMEKLKKIAEDHELKFIIVDHDASKAQGRLVLKELDCFCVAKKREAGPHNLNFEFKREQTSNNLPD